MKISEQLDAVMAAMWENGKATEPTTKALVSYVKNHGNRNPENVFEVIDVLWSNNVRAITQRPNTKDGPREYEVDVQFDDDSQVLLTCRNGIGNAIEVIS